MANLLYTFGLCVCIYFTIFVCLFYFCFYFLIFPRANNFLYFQQKILELFFLTTSRKFRKFIIFLFLSHLFKIYLIYLISYSYKFCAVDSHKLTALMSCMPISYLISYLISFLQKIFLNLIMCVISVWLYTFTSVFTFQHVFVYKKVSTCINTFFLLLKRYSMMSIGTFPF